MVRRFNTNGPVKPERHYYLERTELLKEGIDKIDDWTYFTIFAPRQTGKTTYFQQLTEKIKEERDFLPVWLSFEGFANPDSEEFFDTLQERILEKSCLNNAGINKVSSFIKLTKFFRELYQVSKKDLVLIIDEFEGLKNSGLMNEFLHTLRNIYHNQEIYHLRSVIITGVSNITGLLQDNASPFNIADQINLPYFTEDEVFALLKQHENETGQRFTNEVKENIYGNTSGQPGLVNALARDLVEVEAINKDVITIDDFYRTLDNFMKKYLDKNIINVVNKAKEYPDFMLSLLFGEEIDFDIADERIQYLYVNGVINNCQGKCVIQVPIYEKRIYNYFKPRINGEKRYYLGLNDNAFDYIDERGELKFVRLMDRYISYIKERGAKMFKGRQYYEGVYQYNLDEFLYCYLKELGGRVYPETNIGGGKVDLLISLNNKEYVVEVKANISQTQLKRAKKQLVRYIKRKGINKGFLVIYDDSIGDFDYFEEKIEGLKIYGWLIKTNFKRPSK